MFKLPSIPWDEIEKQLEERVGEVFLKVFETIDDKEEEIKTLRKNFASLNEKALADEVIKKASQNTAVIGGAAALPDLLPGIGWAAMIASLIGDFCLTLREELGMLLQFSFLFDKDEDLQQRKKDVISFLVFLSRDKDNNAFAKEVLEEIQQFQFDQISKKIMIRIGVQLGLKFFRKKMVSFIPGLGIVLSGGVNYLGTRSVGSMGIKFFENKAEFIRTHGQSSSNMEVTNRTTMQMVINIVKMGSSISDEQKNTIDSNLEFFGFSEEEVKSWNEELQKDEINPIAMKDIKAMTDEDKKYVLRQGLQILPNNPHNRQRGYIDFITRAFGLTPSDVNTIKKEIEDKA
ncbi:MAG: hypothetical protein COB02_04490 [Candidatus Cloacimonadota bacterium]|nr:MAG: hypothetical protein COB02_04490 [Candidatus Cloacimonadota bacterium]